MELGHTKGDGTRDAQPLPRSTDENETGCTSCGSAPLPLTVDGTSWCKSRSTKIHTEKPFAQLQSGTNRSFTYNPGIRELHRHIMEEKGIGYSSLSICHSLEQAKWHFSGQQVSNTITDNTHSIGLLAIVASVGLCKWSPNPSLLCSVQVNPILRASTRGRGRRRSSYLPPGLRQRQQQLVWRWKS